MEQPLVVLKESDILAYERTVLAQERTLMAWVRTSLAMITFGFTIHKFFGDLQKTSDTPGEFGGVSKNYGLILVVLGTLFLISASIQNQLVLRDLRVKELKKRISLAFIAAIIISILGLLVLVDMIFHVFI